MERAPHVLVSVLLALAPPLLGQGTNLVPPSASLACIEEMQVPLYEGLMWVARASGLMRVSVNIGADAAATVVIVHGQPPIILEVLKSAMRAAKFSGRCSGQMIEVNFVYRLEGTPDSSPHNRIKIKSGNTFEIVARPPVPMPTQASNPSSGKH